MAAGVGNSNGTGGSISLVGGGTATGTAGTIALTGGTATDGVTGAGGSIVLKAGAGATAAGSIALDDGTGTVLQVQDGSLTQGARLGAVEVTAYSGAGTGRISFLAQGASSFQGAGVDIRTTSGTLPVRVYSAAVAAATASVEVFTGQPTGNFGAGAVSLYGGDGGTAGGAGGAVALRGGAGAAGQNGNGGAVTLLGGPGDGTGIGGSVALRPGSGGTVGTVSLQDDTGGSVLQASSAGLSLGMDATRAVRQLVFAVNDLGSGTPTATLSNTHGAGSALYKTAGASLAFTVSSIADGTAVYVLCANAGGCVVSPLATGANGSLTQGRIGMFVVFSDLLYSSC
jgi:hypothetical protein